MARERPPASGLTFGQFVQQARTARNLTQAEVAQAANVEQAYLSKVELGKREPNIYIALAICDALSIDIDDFVKQYQK